MHKKLKFMFVIFISLFAAASSSLLTAQDKLLDLLTDEMNREMSVLKSQENPPYYMCYRVDDVRRASVNASFGNITNSDESHKRYLTAMLRVGSNTLDNTHEIRGDQFGEIFGRMPQNNLLPIEDDEDAIRQLIWSVTNDEYRTAADKFAKVKANVAVKVTAEDTSADFSVENAKVEYYEKPLNPRDYTFDRILWEDKLKKYSIILLKERDIYRGDASVNFSVERKYFISTEGAQIVQNRFGVRLYVSATIKANDGMELPLYLSYFAYKPENLPKDEQVIKEVTEMVAKLKAMQNAPVVDPYTGPAILSGKAAGVFFHEIFGHRIEGHRQKSENEGQTFAKKVNEKVVSDIITVYDDPTIERRNGTFLRGYYKYDDEGIKSRRVSLVENGVLKGFLMGRSPIRNFSLSNGHGRRSEGFQSVARQGNLIIEASGKVKYEDLRKMLIEECKKQNKPYGLVFDDISGGFTNISRQGPQSFKVLPLLVYRVYPDGRPDEVVRGVDIVGTPLASFNKIIAAADDEDVFNGSCGAESGWVPVSGVAPSLLISEMEVEKKDKSQ